MGFVNNGSLPNLYSVTWRHDVGWNLGFMDDRVLALSQILPYLKKELMQFKKWRIRPIKRNPALIFFIPLLTLVAASIACQIPHVRDMVEEAFMEKCHPADRATDECVRQSSWVSTWKRPIIQRVRSMKYGYWQE